MLIAEPFHWQSSIRKLQEIRFLFRTPGMVPMFNWDSDPRWKLHSTEGHWRILTSSKAFMPIGRQSIRLTAADMTLNSTSSVSIQFTETSRQRYSIPMGWQCLEYFSNWTTQHEPPTGTSISSEEFASQNRISPQPARKICSAWETSLVWSGMSRSVTLNRWQLPNAEKMLHGWWVRASSWADIWHFFAIDLGQTFKDKPKWARCAERNQIWR